MFIALNYFWNLQTENKHFGLDPCFAFTVSHFKIPIPVLEQRCTGCPHQAGSPPHCFGQEKTEALLLVLSLSLLHMVPQQQGKYGGFRKWPVFWAVWPLP